MAEDKTSWSTAITQIKPNEVRVRGYDIAELMGNVSFGAAVYLILRGELPSESIGRLMEKRPPHFVQSPSHSSYS